MKAVVQTEHGDLSSFALDEIPKPTPPPGSVLIRVHASSLNPIDTKRAVFGWKEDWPIIVGYDVAGVIESIGDNASSVAGLKVGDRVYGDIMADSGGKKTTGTLAEYCIANLELLAKMPEGSLFTEMAALPVVGQTSIAALELAGVEKGNKVFITGGAGGVGVHMIQVAKGLFGAGVVATTASMGKAEFVKKYGADIVVDYKKEDAGEKFEGWADTVVDCTGEVEMCKRIVKNEERLCSVAAYGRDDVKALMLKPTREMLERISKLYVAKKITPVIDTVYPLSEGLKAVAHIDGGRSKGKVIVQVRD